MQDEYLESAEFYDHVVPYRDRADVKFFTDYALKAGGPVLEIGCGTGRVLIPTAQAGVTICGLDASPSMLAACRVKLDAESPEVRSRVELHEGDMRNFQLEQKFSLATIPFRPFLHLLTVEDQLACLASIHRHLAPGGKLILDLFNPSIPLLGNDSMMGKEGGDEPEFTMPDGRRVLRRHRYTKRDLFTQIQDIELIHHVTHPDGRTERLVHAFPMRWLFRYEAEHLLARCGFRVESVFAGYDMQPYGSSYPGELIFVATKI